MATLRSATLTEPSQPSCVPSAGLDHNLPLTRAAIRCRKNPGCPVIRPGHRLAAPSSPTTSNGLKLSACAGATTGLKHKSAGRYSPVDTNLTLSVRGHLKLVSTFSHIHYRKTVVRDSIQFGVDAHNQSCMYAVGATPMIEAASCTRSAHDLTALLINGCIGKRLILT